MYRLGFILICLVLACGPPDALAHDFLLERQLEVLDVADLDCDGGAAMLWRQPELVAPSGLDHDCDGKHLGSNSRASSQSGSLAVCTLVGVVGTT